MSRREPSNLAKNLSKSIARLFCELTEIKAKLHAIENDLISISFNFTQSKAKLIQIESDLIFFKELGIEDHINQHNREQHEREIFLDYKEGVKID